VLGVSALPLWFGYDGAGQLLNAHDVSTYAFDFGYDLAGNRISDYAHDQSGNIHVGVLHQYTANSFNQLDTVTTTVNDLPSTEQSLSYDLNGNMIADAAHKSYEWDAANRLTAINYTDTGNRTEFAYDGLGHRVRITEYGPGVTAVAQPAKSIYTTFTTAPFTLPSGGYSLTLQGLNPNGGDNTVLVDSVTLNSTLVANGSFESPIVTDYQTDPSDTAWSYTGTAGIAANGGTYTSNNPNAPAGNQVAFVRNNGLLSQVWTAPAGTYTLNFMAAQRGSGNGSYQQLLVNLRPSASVISAKTFIWCGNQICEERDSTGANVTKRFFADGEQRVGGSDAGNYYYSRDHLGSIREVTNSSGNLYAQYDYDTWGNSVVVAGKMNVDFGYTGHYHHAPSGLNLTLYRAYNSALGRWLSRDPIGEENGLNLYAYVNDNPVNLADPLGLRPLTDCEKNALAPYIPQSDLDNADLHDGTVPWWLLKRYDGITLHNDIYFRPGVYDSSTPAGLALLGHELVHVGQYRNGLTLPKYLWASREGYDQNPYEVPAYEKQAQIRDKLRKSKCCK
jgi:RHS repeat-associated protein